MLNDNSYNIKKKKGKCKNININMPCLFIGRKIEDAVLKKAMEFFKDNAVSFFGIDTKIIAPAETEIKNIDIKTNYTDYLFYTDDGGYLYFEFQTTNKRDSH